MLFHITSKHNDQVCGTTTGEGQSPEYNRWVEGNDKVKGYSTEFHLMLSVTYRKGC